MKKTDILFITLSILCFSPFFFPEVFDIYTRVNSAHPYCLAFMKFALLATYGEVIGLRIKTGHYSEKGFGIFPRAIVWGLLGVWIAIAMKTFATGAPIMAQSLGIEGVADAMKGTLSVEKIVGAFFISLMMNTSFGPVFMTIHKVTDTHILANGGSWKAIITPLPFGKILTSLNWKVQWEFVFKKTIPFFWIPAHTLTFLLPPQFQVLFAAFLGVVLGVILSIAAVMGRKQ